MKHEDTDVTDDEFLVRLVIEHKFRLVGTEYRLKEGIFNPSNNDTDGLSFYRLSCLNSPIQSLDSKKLESHDLFGLVKVTVATIRSLGWNVVRSKEELCPGHVILPQINSEDYGKDDNSDFRAKLLKLKNEAESYIIRFPPKFLKK